MIRIIGWFEESSSCAYAGRCEWQELGFLNSIDVDKLKNLESLVRVKKRLDNVTFDGSWENYKEQVYSAGSDVLGFKKRKNKDWFDESDPEISKLLQKKHRLFMWRSFTKACQVIHLLLKTTRNTKATLQRELRRMKNTWWSNISYKYSLPLTEES